MINLILALSSGVVGGLVVAMMPQPAAASQFAVLIFSVTGGFSWRVAQMVFAARVLEYPVS